MNVYKVGADLGDAIATMAVIRHLGRGHVRLDSNPGTKGFDGPRYDAIVPLLRCQPYVESVERFNLDEKLEVTHDFTGFRNSWDRHPTLVGKQAAHIGLNPDDVSIDPWLHIQGVEHHGKIAIVRSARNKGHLQFFNIWRAKGPECIFFGCQDDYDQFCADNYPGSQGLRQVFKQIEYRRTENLLEATRVILGSRLLVVNQTALFWACYGAGFRRMLVEQVGEDSFLPGVRYIRHAHENLSLREVMNL